MDHVEIKGRRPGKAVLSSPGGWTKVLGTATKEVKPPAYSGIVGGKSSFFGVMTEYISILRDHMFQSNRNTSNHSLQSTRPIMLFQHMSLAIVIPRKAPNSVLAILILAHIPIIRFGGAVTTRHVTIQIPRPVEPLGRATGEVALEGTAVGFEVFTAQRVNFKRGKRLALVRLT